jgi:hypothetical protein
MVATVVATVVVLAVMLYVRAGCARTRERNEEQ